jgi:hypothetical protein
MFYSLLQNRRYFHDKLERYEEPESFVSTKISKWNILYLMILVFSNFHGVMMDNHYDAIL